MCVTLKDGVSLDEVEREVLKVVPQATMLRVAYAEHEQLIEMTARPPATASLPQLAEALRRLPGIAGVNVSS